MDKGLQTYEIDNTERQTRVRIGTKIKTETRTRTIYHDRKIRARKSPFGLSIIILVGAVSLLYIHYIFMYASSNDQEALFEIQQQNSQSLEYVMSSEYGSKQGNFTEIEDSALKLREISINNLKPHKDGGLDELRSSVERGQEIVRQGNIYKTHQDRVFEKDKHKIEKTPAAVPLQITKPSIVPVRNWLVDKMSKNEMNDTGSVTKSLCGGGVEKNDVWDAIDSIIDTYPNSDRSGGLFLYPRQQLFLREMIQHRLLLKLQKGDHEPFRICETGFGGGHFASFVLSLSENIKVISFDKFDRPYQSHIIEYIHAQFGESRLDIVKGDSCKTVPRYLSKKGFPGCDFLHGSSLCKSDNIDLIQYSDCGTILTSTAMSSLSDFHVYFGRKAQWRKLRSDRCISNITCFHDEDVELDKKYVFASKKKKISHKFCFAVNTGICHHSGVPRAAGCIVQEAYEHAELDFINFCPDVQLEVPI